MKSLGNGKLSGGFDADCAATRDILSRVGDKWSVLLIVVLGDETRRFAELKRALDGISQRMLTLTLRGLEKDGLVKRTVHPTVPPKVDYALTPLGQTLIEPVTVLANWAQGHRADIHRARDAYTKPPPVSAAGRRPARGGS